MTTLAELTATTRWTEIKAAPRFEPDEEPALEVIGRNGTCNRDLEEFAHWDERARAEHGAEQTRWSLSFHPWHAWLGMTIEPATLDAHSPAHVVAHCLYDMTFHGFCEATVQDTHQELLRRVAEVDAMSEEEKAEKLIPFEQVMAERLRGDAVVVLKRISGSSGQIEPLVS